MMRNGRPQSVFFISPEVLIEFQDLTRLPYLYDETVLDCITHRYKEDYIYTWAGPILVAVNPFRNLEEFYSKALIKKVFNSIKEGTDKLNPHVYSVAGLAHHRLVAQIGLTNQAILVSGESGAGKTESAKHLLTYLTYVESQCASSPLKGVWQGKQPQDVQRRILASNPILEAFGNSATSRNHNSSRFGKLVRLQYNGHSLKGAEIDTYLLEKTRVTSQPLHERNFHIFYQFLSAVNNDAICDFDDFDVSSFAITPKYNRNVDTNDYEGFIETRKAFERIGVSHKKQMDIFKIIAALLYLGNIKFSLDANKEFWTIASDEGSIKALESASGLLGLESRDLVQVITVKKIVVSSSGKETVFNKSCERKELCEERRDAVMQLLYSSLFAHIVSTINDNTKVDNLRCTSYLGILDVYGFETFDHNSLEQLCINYTNERLQQEFTRRYLASELRILSEEGFLDCPLIYTDNARCVSALDSPVSVFSILNEECQLRREVNEDSTCKRVCEALRTTGIVLQPPSVKTGFIIKHYAGNVNYSSLGLLHKNKDEVPKEITELFSKTKSSYLSQLALKEEDDCIRLASNGTPTRRVRKITTLSKFKSSLDSLMKLLTSCDLHYVRCLKPNVKSVPGSPNEQFLHEQLKSNGILETVKISQAGYPIRMAYKEFVKRYDFTKLELDDKKSTFMIAKKILAEKETDEAPPLEKCRFGKTRIFISEIGLHQLELVRTEHKNKAATCIQKYVRRYQTLKNYKLVMQRLMKLQRIVKTWVCRRKFQRTKRAIITIQSALKTWRCVRNYRRMQKAAIIIQSHVRGWLCRKHHPKLIPSPLRSLSSISYASNGYYSMNTLSSYTDNSISDAETISINDEAFLLPIYERMRSQRLLETEESGVETDTESMSGDGLKVGRSSKFRHKRQQGNLMAKGPLSLGTNLSDEDLNEMANKSSSLRGKRPRTFPSKLISRSIYTQLQNKLREATNCEKELHDLRVVTLKHFHRISSVLRETDQSVQLSLPDAHSPIFFRDGIISYRQMPKGMIKFHTRRTCLPFSTCLPYQEKPQGLIDAIR